MTRTSATAVKMLESLPESAQEKIVEKLSELVEDQRDDIRWERLFRQYEKGLIKVAEEALRESHSGKAKKMDYSKL